MAQVPSYGFRPEVMGYPVGSETRGHPSSGPQTQQPSDPVPVDTSRDLIYMRILSAEEFLARMWESDETIKNFALCGSIDMFTIRIRELLGLRGHLQDELLRIEAMLAADDPQLRCLDNFEREFPEAIRRLRDLHRTSQSIEIQSNDIGLDSQAPPSTSTLPPINSTGQRVVTQQQRRGSESQDHRVAMTAENGEEVIESQLRPKFVAEEDHVTDDFTKRITQRGQTLSAEELDALLREHSISMQALRKKQQMERGRYKDILETKKKERLLKKRGEQNNERRMSGPQLQGNNSKGEYFFIDFSKDVVKTDNPRPLPKRPGKSSLQSTWFYVDMDGNSVANKPQDKVVPDSTDKDKSNSPRQSVPVTTTSAIQSKSEKVHNSSSQGQSHVIGSMTVSSSEEEEETSDEEDYDDDFEEADSDEGHKGAEDREELLTTLKDDLWSTLKDRQDTTKEDFEELLGAFREQQVGRKAMKDSQDTKHKASFLAKLAARKKKEANVDEVTSDFSSQASLSSNSSTDSSVERELEDIRKVDSDLINKILSQRRLMSDSDFQDLLRRHLSDVERLRRQRANEREKIEARLQDKLARRKPNSPAEDEETSSDLDELHERLSELDEQMTKELERRGKNIDESDLEELLAHYRRQQETLMKRRAADKTNMDDKLKRKLEEKRRLKQEYQASQNASMKTHPDGDESFFQEIQSLQSKGQLTEAMFTSLLTAHLTKADQAKRQQRRQLIERDHKDDSAARDAAMSLVEESQAQTKQIQGIRQREKQAMDEKLRRKLQAKKNKKATVNE